MTILAVVAGLALAGASAVSHDLSASVFRKGQADSADELRVSRGRSWNFPVLLLSLLWPGCTTRGVVAGGSAGLVVALVLTVLSPTVWASVGSAH